MTILTGEDKIVQRCIRRLYDYLISDEVPEKYRMKLDEDTKSAFNWFAKGIIISIFEELEAYEIIEGDPLKIILDNGTVSLLEPIPFDPEA